MDAGIYSAIDANINRALEGMRVCEDILRFVIRNAALSAKLKETRHEFAEAVKRYSQIDLLYGRDVESDSQKFYDAKSEKNRDSLIDLAKSNSHRAMESMRTIEEFYKFLHPGIDENPFQKIRFMLYALEKEMISILLRQDKHRRFNKSLYAILDSSYVRNDEYAKMAERLIKGGASVIQLRMKNYSTGKVLERAKEVSHVCRENDVLFIVNDYPDITILSGADGVHLGQEDLPVMEARRILPPDKIIGVSTHSMEQAMSALQYEPDYIALGPIFETGTKNNILLDGIGEDVLKELIKITEIPIVAIGGLCPEKMAGFKDLGCSCGALVSYLYKENKIEKNCRMVLNCLKA
ncbi:MAG: thiamine phosphate synthase [Spirochaetes bacterium]|nr:thiamine phosphate synthase [Spirochaetota bacterium]